MEKSISAGLSEFPPIFANALRTMHFVLATFSSITPTVSNSLARPRSFESFLSALSPITSLGSAFAHPINLIHDGLLWLSGYFGHKATFPNAAINGLDKLALTRPSSLEFQFLYQHSTSSTAS